ncbi:MAG: PadR family transcriptional regulator [Firmicutes bacterium]|nr:PadR family transcriptional regulator [Bacillota bacterium]
MNEKITLSEATYYILLSLKTPLHGYGILKKVKLLTNNRLILSSGTLYGAITSLQKNNFIELFSKEQGKKGKKNYVMTPLGFEVLKSEINRFKEMAENGRSEISK